jgi:hypothetical protein
VREAQQAGLRSVAALLRHGAGRGSRARPRLPRVGLKLRPREATRQLVIEVGIERVHRERLPVGGAHLPIYGKDVALQTALLAVAAELLVRVLRPPVVAILLAGFGRGREAPQPK